MTKTSQRDYSIYVTPNKTHKDFLISWVGASAALYIFSLILPSAVVLGNDKINGLLAVVAAGLVIAIVNFIVSIYYKKLGLKIKDEYMAALCYFLADVVVIWVIKRFALTTGLGISNNIYVLILGALLAFLKYSVDSNMILGKKKK